MISRIKQYTLQAGWSSADLSRKCNIPPRIAEAWERGTMTPPAWAEALVLRKMQEERTQAARRKADEKSTGKQHASVAAGAGDKIPTYGTRIETIPQPPADTATNTSDFAARAAAHFGGARPLWQHI